MGFMEAVKICFSKYATFEGRARRAEYWWFYLFTFLAGMVIYALGIVAFGAMGDTAGAIFIGLFVLFWLAMLIPSIAVTVRRLHDTDKSGWWYFIAFIPFGAFVLLVFMCLQGTQGENRFGADPLGTDPSVFA